ncbi:lipocalin family protein [Xanthomarina sp. F1114]|uniref:lipocalin family protein n=1 Tax=Xanthomarina sp. F1114 TaxID=2996019 RepID=UPI00225E4549|nr:lipocalin family protein [Xanthomarina sp. F1114]MCX7548766.1 lipocalin family protein [Xanthomarina sp. F1114]
MKIFKFILFSFLIIANVSCSSDDDNIELESNNLIGTWTLTEGHIPAGSADINLGGMTVPIEYEGSFVNIEESNRLNFMQDNTFTSVTGNISLEMQMTVMGTPQNQSFEGSDLFGQGTWEVNGNELLIHNENGTTIKYYIDQIDGNVLKLSANLKDMNTGTPNPMLESMDIIIKMTLERV